ncbi:MAG: hypothetical protein SCABRO_00744 [Candidatus Scalindua brodae]|uniref:Uncharacterized protein n=1 Tax=Candidatus Scalindua brodae TaxID=237368 RepID=A0A0B0ELG7_9BACT|nr:MAG: hypothetical protein SCABRO_00744 [Candidatus Scalindua brodae]
MNNGFTQVLGDPVVWGARMTLQALTSLGFIVRLSGYTQ